MNVEIRKFFDENGAPRPITYQPCTQPQQVLKQSGLPYLPIIGFNPPIKDMYDEAQRLIPLMVSHRSDYENHQGWKSLVLHGLGATKTEGAERYGLDPEDKSIYQWTEIAHMAPVTTAFFRDHFHYDAYQRVRFMLLEPGGYVTPHTDFDHYVLGPVNMALNNPEGCEFVMKDVGALPFRAGSIIKLALVNQHAVFNNSKEPRIHMIIHGSPNFEYWQHRYMESYHELIRDSRFQPANPEKQEHSL